MLDSTPRNRTNLSAAPVTCPDGVPTVVATASALGLVLVMFTLWVDNQGPDEIQLVAGITGASPQPAIDPDVTGPLAIPSGDANGIRGFWHYQANGAINLQATVAGGEAAAEGTVTVIPVARVLP